MPKKLQSPRPRSGRVAVTQSNPPISVEIREGVVSVQLGGAAVFPAGRVTAIFDGHAVIDVTLRSPTQKLIVSLPPDSLPSTLDLVDSKLGRSLLPAPLSLDDHLGLMVDKIGFEDGAMMVDVSMAGKPVAALAVTVVSGQDTLIAAGAAPRERGLDAGRSRYRCALPLLSLPPIDRPQSLAIYVNGRRVGLPLMLSAQQVGFAGYLEHAAIDGIAGWAVNLRDPGRPVTIEVKADDRLLGSVVASVPRPELQAIGIAVPCGFIVPTAMFETLQNGESLSLVLAGTPTNLVNSPQKLIVEEHIRGLFDSIEGNRACGWVVNLTTPDQPCVVEAVCEGRVIGTAEASGLRRDVLEAGIPTDRCGFRITFQEPLHTLFDRDIIVRIQDSGVVLNGGPQQPKLNPNIRTYLTPDRGIGPGVIQRLRRRINHAARGAGVSLIMPVYNTRREWLTEALRSVCMQWCESWELICVDDASTEPHVAAVLAWFSQMDSRIRVIRSPENEGVAGATNRGIREARYPYLALMDHDDVLEPDAVHHLVATARKTGADLLYSDEAITSEDSSVVLDVRGRPAFSYDYYLSHPYFVHLVAVRREIAQRIGGFDGSLKISADVDFVLRAIEQSRSVAHIPRVLYRWRTHTTSTGHEKQGQVMEATTAILQRHLDRVNPGAVARPAREFNQFEISWPDPGGRVLIVIPTKDGIDVLRQCIESIEATTPAGDYRLVVIDHESKQAKSRQYLAALAERHTVLPYKGRFNYARMNNRAIRSARADEPFVLFMNNDIEAVEPGWLQRMRSLAVRPDVGAVGTALMYSDRRIQHGGVIVGINGLADHALRFEPVWAGDGSRTLGYNATLPAVRDFSAVTAACMMMRMEVFDEVSGFDEAFAVGFNDTDLCLRVGRAGYKVLYDGRTVLYHHESVTRIAKAQLKHVEDDRQFRKNWGALLKAGDPYYSPLLELYGSDHKLRLNGCAAVAPRVVAVAFGGRTLPEAAAKPARDLSPIRTAV